MKQSVLIFLHRCIQNISTLVMVLSVASLLPSTVILSLTLGGNLSPAIITLLTVSLTVVNSRIRILINTVGLLQLHGFM